MAGSIFKMLTQIIVLIIYARKLSLVDYAVYQSVWLYVNVISVVSLFSLPSIILTAGVNNIKIWITNNKNTFWFFTAVFNFGPVVYMFLVPSSFTFTTTILLLCLTVIQNGSVITEAIAVKQEKEKLLFTANILFSVCFLVAHLIIISVNYSLQWLLVILIFIFFLKIIFQWLYMDKISEKTVTNSVKYGKQWLFLGLNDISGVIFKWFDKWIILFFLTLPEFAVYFNGSYEVPVFGLMAGAAGNIMLAEYCKGNDGPQLKAKAIFANSTLLLSRIVFPAFCFLLLYRYEFFTFIFSSKYAEAVPVFLITLFVLPVRITNFTAVLQAEKRSDIILKGSMLDLLTAILLMLILYPIYKTKGLALACVISTYLQAGYYLWQTGNLLKKPVFYFFPIKKLIGVMFFSAGIMTAGYLLFRNMLYPMNMISGIIISFMLMIVFIYSYYADSKKEMLID